MRYPFQLGDSAQVLLNESLTAVPNIGGIARLSMLLDSGADPAFVGRCGASLITEAIRADRSDVLHLLSSRNYDFGNSDAVPQYAAVCDTAGATDSKTFFDRMAGARRDAQQVNDPADRAQSALKMLRDLEPPKPNRYRP